MNSIQLAVAVVRLLFKTEFASLYLVKQAEFRRLWRFRNTCSSSEPAILNTTAKVI